MRAHLSNREVNDISRQQLFSLERKIHKGEFSIESVGDYLPGNLLVTDLSNLTTVYMNQNGCNILKHNVEELKELGPEYLSAFFVEDEIEHIVQNYLAMQQNQNVSGVFNFVHRVKPLNETAYKWYFASAKLFYKPQQAVSDKMLLIVNEVNSVCDIAKKINSVLEESDWMKNNFNKFCRLTRREKEIITLLTERKNSRQISDSLFISRLTVNTYRRNIAEKLETKSFAALYKFALTFGLIQ